MIEGFLTFSNDAGKSFDNSCTFGANKIVNILPLSKIDYMGFHSSPYLIFRPFSRWRLYRFCMIYGTEPGLPHRGINIVGLIPLCGINRASVGFLSDVGFLRENRLN